MNHKDIKLTLRQMIKPSIEIAKQSVFIWVIAGFTVFTLWNCYIASLFPKILSNAFFDSLFSFGLAIGFHILTLLFPFIIGVWWSDSESGDSGQKQYQHYKNIRDKIMLNAKMQVWENVVDDEVLK